ncbi:hypothetical protein CR513_39085, partial [Mucuna pruriens]
MFKERDLVWVHLRKKRFPTLKKRINDNAYKVSMPQDYKGSNSFNISNLSPCVISTQVPNLRSNSLKK